MHFSRGLISNVKFDPPVTGMTLLSESRRTSQVVSRQYIAAFLRAAVPIELGRDKRNSCDDGRHKER
jgi:hypothetical protein